jgi:RHS repeat-associated protein
MLSAVKWMSKDGSGASSYERSYKYTYDALGRYNTAAYAERTTNGTGAFNNNIGGFDENVGSYDVNGNIVSLTRNSSTQGTNTHTQIDNLAYTYDSANPNQLQKVSDGTGGDFAGYGFRNLTGALSTSTYSYDANGNLAADPYKGLALAYNDLNRTDKITVTTATNRYIDYTYDATGALIRKRVYDNSALQATTDYVDGFVYINSALSYFPMPEGRVRNTGSSLKPEYIITDQQGNARISFEESTTAGVPVVRQENSYYAFGLTMAHSPVTTPGAANKQLYNGGSEWQSDYSDLPDLQQTFYRNYDAALGRFVAVDPMAEGTGSMTVYQYADNNPVMMNDPMGDFAPYYAAMYNPRPEPSALSDFYFSEKMAWGFYQREANEFSGGYDRNNGNTAYGNSDGGGGGGDDETVDYVPNPSSIPYNIASIIIIPGTGDKAPIRINIEMDRMLYTHIMTPVR